MLYRTKNKSAFSLIQVDEGTSNPNHRTLTMTTSYAIALPPRWLPSPLAQGPGRRARHCLCI